MFLVNTFQTSLFVAYYFPCSSFYYTQDTHLSHSVGRALTSDWFTHPAGRAPLLSGSYTLQEEYALLASSYTLQEEHVLLTSSYTLQEEHALLSVYIPCRKSMHF